MKRTFELIKDIPEAKAGLQFTAREDAEDNLTVVDSSLECMNTTTSDVFFNTMVGGIYGARGGQPEEDAEKEAEEAKEALEKKHKLHAILEGLITNKEYVRETTYDYVIAEAVEKAVEKFSPKTGEPPLRQEDVSDNIRELIQKKIDEVDAEYGRLQNKIYNEEKLYQAMAWYKFIKRDELKTYINRLTSDASVCEEKSANLRALRDIFPLRKNPGMSGCLYFDSSQCTWSVSK